MYVCSRYLIERVYEGGKHTAVVIRYFSCHSRQEREREGEKENECCHFFFAILTKDRQQNRVFEKPYDHINIINYSDTAVNIYTKKRRYIYLFFRFFIPLFDVFYLTSFSFAFSFSLFLSILSKCLRFASNMRQMKTKKKKHRRQ